MSVQSLGTARVVDLRHGPTPRIGGRDDEHVRVLQESFDQLPPIVVHRPTMMVIDGAHRLLAAKRLGRSTIRVEFFTGSSAAAYVEAVRRNIAHGKPLTLTERRQAAREIVDSHPNWSDARVAAACALSDKTVAALRASDDSDGVDARVGSDGRTRPVDVASRRLRAADLLGRSPELSLRAVARAVNLSPATVLDVRRRLLRNDSPVTGKPDPVASGEGRAHPARSPEGRPTPLAVMTDLIDSVPWISNPCRLDTQEQREFATWFRDRVRDSWRFSRFIDNVPNSDQTSVVVLALVQARSWAKFAAEVERRIGPVDMERYRQLVG